MKPLYFQAFSAEKLLHLIIAFGYVQCREHRINQGVGMKKLIMALVVMVVIGSNLEAKFFNIRGSNLAADFKETLRVFEEGGAKNAELQKKLCALGVARLNELREVVLAKFPALQEKKANAEKSLGIVVQELGKNTEDSPTGKSLLSKKQDYIAQLGDIEDEIEAQLHSDQQLTFEFNKIRETLKHWCD